MSKERRCLVDQVTITIVGENELPTVNVAVMSFFIVVSVVYRGCLAGGFLCLKRNLNCVVFTVGLVGLAAILITAAIIIITFTGD